MYALTRSLIRSHALRQGLQMAQITAARPITMKIVPAREDKNESYDEKNMRLKRELSPHISIYKPQLTSILSLSHRITGMALTTYVWTLGIGALVSSHDVNHYVTMAEGLELGSVTLSILKFMLAFPFAYHFCNGFRHLLWDMGRYLRLKEVYSTGYAMLIIATCMAVGLTML